MTNERVVWLAIVGTTIVGPVALALAGIFFRSRAVEERSTDPVASATSAWPLIVNSAAAYALAFNIVFFIQELFLVLPKAITPGLRPTLFHNNHTWSGDNPLAPLLQGTGVLAIFVT